MSNPKTFFVLVAAANGTETYLVTNADTTIQSIKLVTGFGFASVYTEEEFNKVWFEYDLAKYFNNASLYAVAAYVHEGLVYTTDGSKKPLVIPIKQEAQKQFVVLVEKPTGVGAYLTTDKTRTELPVGLSITFSSASVYTEDEFNKAWHEYNLVEYFSDETLYSIEASVRDGIVYVHSNNKKPLAKPTKQTPAQTESLLLSALDNSDLNELLARATEAAKSPSPQKHFVVFVEISDTHGGYLNTEDMSKNLTFRIEDNITDASVYTESSFNKQWIDNHLAVRFINNSVHIIGITIKDGVPCPDPVSAKLLEKLTEQPTDIGGVDFIKKVADKGYYEGAKQNNNEEAYLVIQLSKRRSHTTTPDEGKFCIYEFPYKMLIPDDQSTLPKFPCILVDIETREYVYKTNWGYSTTSDINLADVFHNQDDIDRATGHLTSKSPTFPLPPNHFITQPCFTSTPKDKPMTDTDSTTRNKPQEQFVIYVSTTHNGIMYLNTSKPYTGLLSVLVSDINNATVFTEESFNKVLFSDNLEREFRNNNLYWIKGILKDKSIHPVSDCAKVLVKPTTQEACRQFVVYIVTTNDGIMYLNTKESPLTLGWLVNDFNAATVYTEESFNTARVAHDLTRRFRKTNLHRIEVIIKDGVTEPIGSGVDSHIPPISKVDSQLVTSAFPCVLGDPKTLRFISSACKTGYDLSYLHTLAKIFNNQTEMDAFQDQIPPSLFRTLSRMAPPVSAETTKPTEDEYMLWVMTANNSGFVTTVTTSRISIIKLEISPALADRHPTIEKALQQKTTIDNVTSFVVMKLTKYKNLD